MSEYARIYRAELQELKPAPAFYRLALRLVIAAACVADRYPRTVSAILWAVSLWAVVYIFFNYRFTTYL
jgi:hypothetical protein